MVRSAARSSTCFRAGRALYEIVLSGTSQGCVQPVTRDAALGLRTFAAMPEMSGPPIGSERPRVVILGTGWAAARVAQVGVSHIHCACVDIVTHPEHCALDLE